MRPLTDHTPKPLLKVKGKSLIEYHIDALQSAGVKRLVINHAWLGQQIEQNLGDGSRYGLEIVYSAENPALETAGGIVKALPLLCPGDGNNNFIIVNGDIFSDFDFRTLPQQLGNDLAHLVMVDNPEHNPGGDFAISAGRLTDSEQDKLTFSGIAVYNPDFFAGLSVKSLPLAPLLRHFIAQGKVGAQYHGGLWCDVGTPQRLARLNQQEKN